MLSKNCAFIHSTTFEEHLFKMFLLFKKIPTKNDLYEMCLDYPYFKDNNKNEQIKFSYTEYLYKKLNASFSTYFRNDTDNVNSNGIEEMEQQLPWHLDIPFQHHANVCTHT